ncbi:S41 family peptidase [Nonomuraea sp. NPDC050663]|uniref:S41 family peptidase n=1 Tax=Nonomuraea sp. NPDC050663 TaxID=3364370 RepID=UPI0037903629
MTIARTVVAALVLVLAAACTAPAPPRAEAGAQSGTACAPPGAAPGAETATTIDVIGQAYRCILGNHYGGATLDSRPLLVAAFAALARELDRAGHDVPEAVMPALSGDRTADWAAFEAAYRKVTARVTERVTGRAAGRVTDQVPGLRDKLAVVTLEALVAALGDNHASWTRQAPRPPGFYDGDGYGLGLEASVSGMQASGDLVDAAPPLFVTAVQGGAARAAGLRPGDVIESINGSAPFADGRASPALTALYPAYPEARPVRLRLLRQGASRSVTLKPGLFPRDLASLQVVRSRLMDDVAYVKMTGFAPDSANRVLRAVTRMRAGRTLSGVVLDLRGNGGGSPVEATRLLSAFVHGRNTAYQCTADGACQTTPTDDTVELLRLPLVVLADRGCASACEHFGAAVKDLRLGPLVGTRTAGLVSGPARTYLLANNTFLSLPSRHHRAPGGQVIDRIGVPPDHHVPATPADAAAGHDAALAKALSLLPA